MRWLCAILCVPSVATWAAQANATTELTPEVKARLYEPTKDIRLVSPVVRVPMRGTDARGNAKCPYFEVYVNGKGPFTFLYDTGAAYLTIDSKVAEAARTPVVFDRAGRRDVVQIDHISLGGVELGNVWSIHDDANVRAVGVDGVMGFPTLGQANVLFDLARREILVSRRSIPMGRSFSLPFESPLNVPEVPVTIGGRKVPLLLDTGDDAFGLDLRSSEVGNAAIEHPPTAGPAVFNGATKQQSALTILKDPVMLGPVQAKHAALAINEDLPIGDLGYDALRQFRFQINPTRRTVTFQPLFEGREFRLTSKR